MDETDNSPNETVGGEFYERLVAEAAERMDVAIREAAERPRPATFGPGIEQPQQLRLPETDAASVVDQIDPDRLSHAMAVGMWTRFEWALGQIGEMRETIAALQEGIRVRDEEIGRLIAMIDIPTVSQIARHLLS